MVNSVDPDQTAPSESVCSGPTLFAYAILSETGIWNFMKFTIYVCVCVMLTETK